MSVVHIRLLQTLGNLGQIAVQNLGSTSSTTRRKKAEGCTPCAAKEAIAAMNARFGWSDRKKRR